jgi:hypothetical protein
VGIRTVKFLLQTLFRKTGVRTRAQLVRIVLEEHRETLRLTANGTVQRRRPAARPADGRETTGAPMSK